MYWPKHSIITILEEDKRKKDDLAKKADLAKSLAELHATLSASPSE